MVKANLYVQIKEEIAFSKEIRISRAERAKALAKRYREKAVFHFRCIDCGEGDPLLLEFDPKDNVEIPKNRSLTRLANNGAARELVDEIEINYVVRCLHCQRINLALTGKDERINERVRIMSEMGIKIFRKRNKSKSMELKRIK